MTDASKVTASDVAMFRALARQIKTFYPTLNIEYCREMIKDSLELPDELIELLLMACDPDFIEEVTSRAVSDFY